jgi:hypothetical protein
VAIIRGALSPDNYTIVPNEWLRDQRLSYKAKGILAYIMSHRADYELTVEQMVEQSSDGAGAIYSGLKELVDVGYLLRERRRNPNGTLGATDYRVAAVDPATSQKSTSGKPRCGADQGGHNEAAGQTASRKSTSGKPTSGKSATKKEHLLEEQGLEDQEKTPTPGPTPLALTDTADEQGEGRADASQEEPPSDAVEDLVREVVALRPDWSPRDVRRVATDPEVTEREPALVRAAFLIAAHDRHTKVPGRLLHAACPHWEHAARELGLLAHDDPGAGGPPPKPPQCPDGLCDGSGRFLQVVERQEVRGYKDGKPIFGTVEDEVPTTCTACYPGYRQLAGTRQGV